MQLTILVSDPAIALTEGVGKVRIPFHQDFKVAWAIAWLDTVQDGGDPVIVEVSQEETIFSATIENDANESAVSEGGLIARGFASIDVPQVGNGSAMGLWLTISGEYMPCTASEEDPGEPPPEYTTWNPSDKASGITLSNGNLTAAWSGATQNSVRAVKGLSSGKWYWECTPASMSGTGFVGLAKAAASLSQYVGENANGWGLIGNISGNAKAYTNASPSFTGATWGNGDVISVAFDADAGKLYWAKNGTWYNSGNPAAGTGAIFTGLTSGPYYPACSDGSSGSDTGNITANFGASAWAHSPPSGFSGVLA